MGHQHHFLSRLDRVSLPHVELALSLYRDPELLRYVLSRVRLPHSAERVAVSLEHAERGPFLVVTRDGKFVTCLGEGMSATGLPVVTRGQLDAIAARAGELRERMAACLDLASKRGGIGGLMRRLYDAADELSREEFVAISALQPLYAYELFKDLLGFTSHLFDRRDLLVKQLRKSEKLRPPYREMLRDYWNTAWTIGHVSVLAAMEGPGLMEKIPEIVRTEMDATSYSWASVRQGVIALAVRGIWGAARIGKPLLPTYKRLFGKASTELTVIDHSCSLAALGMRHGKLTAEVRKTLASGPPLDATTALGRYLGAYMRIVKVFAETGFSHPDALMLAHRILGADLTVHLTKDLPKGSAYRFERAEEVPEDLAMVVPVNMTFSFLEKPRVLEHLLVCLPWVSRVPAESLYLPADFIRAVRVPWTEDLALNMLRAHRDHLFSKAPVKRAEGPARKGPCPCGSGKKYKRCCGEPGAPAVMAGGASGEGVEES